MRLLLLGLQLLSLPSAGLAGFCTLTTPAAPIEKALAGIKSISFEGVEARIVQMSAPAGTAPVLKVTSYTSEPQFLMDQGRLIVTTGSCAAPDQTASGEQTATSTSAPGSTTVAPESDGKSVDSALRRAVPGLLGAMALFPGKLLPAIGAAFLFFAGGARADAHCGEMVVVEIITAGDMAKPAWHSTFPPASMSTGGGGFAASPEVEAWMKENVAALPMIEPPTMTDREKELVKMGAGEYMAARKAGTVTCVEYATALTKRATHYKAMNQFMYWDNMPDQMDVVLAQAAALDKKAEAGGVEAIAPLYCLPVPAKGTMASVDFPSSAGSGILHNFYGKSNAGAINQVITMNGVVFGKTNVPEFAASWISCNYANGCTLNPHGHHYTTGGSSGGSGSAVASYIAPVAFSEDTGGSTRHPAAQNHNFGYDPTRNHYPNSGNPGITYTQDQVGINARSIEDVIAFDGALLGIQAEHDAAAAATPALAALKVGTPLWPFVEYYVPEYSSSTNVPKWPSVRRPSTRIMAKYDAVKAALAAGGVTLVEKEWPDNADGRNTLAATWHGTPLPGGDGSATMDTIHGLISFTGQMAEWIRTFLDSGIGPKDVIMDSYTAGSGHAPAGWMGFVHTLDESLARYSFGLFQLETVAAWNSYFDTHGVDVIMTPASFCDAMTYECAAVDKCVCQIDQDGDGSFTEDQTSLLNCNIVPYGAFKTIPIPKVVFPVGLDANGGIVNMEFWGRSGPKDSTSVDSSHWIYNDAWAKTADVEFLQQVKTLVTQVYTVDDLKRVEPKLVTMGTGNLF